MPHDNQDFINCAMGALEEGIASAEEIIEECACRMGLTGATTPQPSFKE